MEDAKLRAVAIDDEQHCLDTLVYELERHCPNVQLIQQFRDPIPGEKFLRESDIDLLFLDINLQSTSGITLLESIWPVNFEVIFITAYDEYAIKAFELSAAHYLMKPVNGTKLKSAVEKVRERKQKEQSSLDLEAISEQLKIEFNKSDKISLPVHDGIEFILPSDIIYVEGENNYSTLYLRNGEKLVISKTLKYLEENKLPTYFLRVHKSFIVNVHELKKYVKSDGGYIILNTEKQIPVSRQKRTILNKLFD